MSTKKKKQAEQIPLRPRRPHIVLVGNPRTGKSVFTETARALYPGAVDHAAWYNDGLYTQFDEFVLIGHLPGVGGDMAQFHKPGMAVAILNVVRAPHVGDPGVPREDGGYVLVTDFDRLELEGPTPGRVFMCDPRNPAHVRTILETLVPALRKE